VADKDQFFSFDEALDQLRLKEEELKRLVSEGEIRAFRDGETMKLRVSDVESLRSELSGGEVVDLGLAGEELVFEDDAELEPAGLATEEISEMDTLLDDDVEDVGELELELALDVLDEVEDVGEVEELVEVDEPLPRAKPVLAAVAEESEGAGVRFLLIATSLILTLAIPVAIAASTGRVSELVKSIGGIFGKQF
jgi:excisionase family DNA binding protein